jgi:hypothetical protein
VARRGEWIDMYKWGELFKEVKGEDTRGKVYELRTV